MNKEEMICIAGEDGIVKEVPISEAFTKFENIKKHFNYHDTPTTYRDRTLNEQWNDYLKSLERDMAIKIFNDLCNYSTFDGPMQRVYICVSDYLAIRKKYTGEPKQ